eukprot:6214731-Pleurochrysis_carterae.AAC.1
MVSGAAAAVHRGQHLHEQALAREQGARIVALRSLVTFFAGLSKAPALTVLLERFVEQLLLEERRLGERRRDRHAG